MVTVDILLPMNGVNGTLSAVECLGRYSVFATYGSRKSWCLLGELHTGSSEKEGGGLSRVHLSDINR